MIVDKTKLGLSFFDDRFGGVYRGRPVLCFGKKGSGKSVLAYHFLSQALLDGDKALLLSNFRAHDTVIVAESLGLPFAEAVSKGQLTILEYASFIPESTASTNMMLPPQSFMELQDIVESRAIRRLALDTVLPWVAIQPLTRIAEHVYSFIHALERLGASSILTLPKPVSNAAFTLKSRLEDLCPITINLDHEGTSRSLRITKYLGEAHNISVTFPFAITPGKGLTACDPSEKRTPAPSAAPAPQPAAPAPQPKKPISFSSVIRFPE